MSVESAVGPDHVMDSEAASLGVPESANLGSGQAEPQDLDVVGAELKETRWNYDAMYVLYYLSSTNNGQADGHREHPEHQTWPDLFKTTFARILRTCPTPSSMNLYRVSTMRCLRASAPCTLSGSNATLAQRCLVSPTNS